MMSGLSVAIAKASVSCAWVTRPSVAVCLRRPGCSGSAFRRAQATRSPLLVRMRSWSQPRRGQLAWGGAYRPSETWRYLKPGFLSLVRSVARGRERATQCVAYGAVGVTLHCPLACKARGPWPCITSSIEKGGGSQAGGPKLATGAFSGPHPSCPFAVLSRADTEGLSCQPPICHHRRDADPTALLSERHGCHRTITETLACGSATESGPSRVSTTAKLPASTLSDLILGVCLSWRHSELLPVACTAPPGRYCCIASQVTRHGGTRYAVGSTCVFCN